MSVGQEIAIDVLMENFLAKLSNSDAIIIFAQFWKFESQNTQGNSSLSVQGLSTRSAPNKMLIRPSKMHF